MTQKTQPTYEDLIKPMTPLSVPWFKWTVAKGFLGSFGRLSEGVRIGFRSGFDSGQMLDYVYRNEPRGDLVIGRCIDKFYLNSPGWTGIRQRKVHLKRVLNDIIETRDKHKEPTVIMDLASGPGQYLIEVLQEKSGKEVQVICRDLSEGGLEEGRRKAVRFGLKNIKYEKADAFSPQELQRATPRPNVIVVSGLYELFTDNETIRRSMKSIAQVLQPGEHFIVTNQPHHPQLEMIARVLPNRMNKPWVMRLRSDETIKQWAKEAGFQHEFRLIDQEGIFSVHKFKKV